MTTLFGETRSGASEKDSFFAGRDLAQLRGRHEDDGLVPVAGARQVVARAQPPEVAAEEDPHVVEGRGDPVAPILDAPLAGLALIGEPFGYDPVDRLVRWAELPAQAVGPNERQGARRLHLGREETDRSLLCEGPGERQRDRGAGLRDIAQRLVVSRAAGHSSACAAPALSIKLAAAGSLRHGGRDGSPCTSFVHVAADAPVARVGSAHLVAAVVEDGVVGDRLDAEVRLGGVAFGEDGLEIEARVKCPDRVRGRR